MSGHAILTAEAHGDLRIDIGRGAESGDAVMSAIVMPNEFRQIQNEYPILFKRTAERDGFSAFALFGFEAGENLFLDDAHWDARHRPLTIDIQPFLIGRPADGSETNQVHIDLSHSRVSMTEGTRIFDEFGRPTPYLETIAEQLGTLNAGLAGANEYFDALERYDLLEPLTLEITLDDGSINRLVGFHVIDEKRLQALDAGALGELHVGDHLMPTFMALASLANLGTLIARKNRRAANG